MAPKPKKVATPKKIATPTKKIDPFNDFNFLNTYNPLAEQGIANRNVEQGRLNSLRTGIFGAGGALAQNREEGVNTQNRIADEMAYRGLLSSGAYAGSTKGVGTQSQAAYQQQDTNLRNQYASQANPMNLLEQGLKMNPDGSISPLAPGEEIADPSTGEKVKYDWATQTSAGRQARLAALAQYAALTARTKV
jgi:hypothetical protein